MIGNNFPKKTPAENDNDYIIIIHHDHFHEKITIDW